MIEGQDLGLIFLKNHVMIYIQIKLKYAYKLIQINDFKIPFKYHKGRNGQCIRIVRFAVLILYVLIFISPSFTQPIFRKNLSRKKARIAGRIKCSKAICSSRIGTGVLGIA